MSTNNSLLSTRVANYNLSFSYPNMTNMCQKELNYSNSFSLNSCTKSWNNYQNNNILKKSIIPESNHKNLESVYNCDLQPLTWLQKESIIDIDPLVDIEDIKEDSISINMTPGYEDLVNPQINHARVEVESQENSNVHDFVRFQAMRNSKNNGNRVALRNNNSFVSINGTINDQNQVINRTNYSHQASGFIKPNLSYTQLIFMAIETCKDRAMTVNDIYQWCEINYPYYKHIGPSWKNSLRHNLSINKSFRRMPRDGQSSVVNYEFNTSDDICDEALSYRDNKQGGPGRGAYWVVDDKERKNLLDSIYRAQQVMPLSDRNGQRVDASYSVIINPPKNGPMLRIDGRFTDASTYLQSKRIDDDISNDNQNGPNQDSTTYENTSDLLTVTENSDIEYASMMQNLTSNRSHGDTIDGSIKLSTSYNSNSSRMKEPEQDILKPKLKNRRKSKHEKVRSCREIESSTKDGFDTVGCKYPNRTSNSSSSDKPSTPGMTSVNVIVAPHFDHIYARYQQFLPPAISTNMDKAVFAPYSEVDSNPDAEFLKHGYREDDDDEEEDNDEDDEPRTSGCNLAHESCGSVPADVGTGLDMDGVTVKLEKVESGQHLEQQMEPGLMRHYREKDTMRNKHQGDCGKGGLRLLWNGRNNKLKSSTVAFTRQRKVRKVLRNRVRRNLGQRQVGGDGAKLDVEVKQEMMEMPVEEMIMEMKEELSDGYGTDSTMPMVVRQQTLKRKNNVTTSKRRTNRVVRLKSLKRNEALTKTAYQEKRLRSKRKKTRPLRIDESKEIAAIHFLASLEKRHQKLKNIENLYHFNTYLKSSLSTGDSSCNSSVVLVHE